MIVHPLMDRESKDIVFVYFEEGEPRAEVYQFFSEFGLVTHYLAIGLKQWYIDFLEVPTEADQFILTRAVKMAKRHFGADTVFEPTKPNWLKEEANKGDKHK